MGAMRYAPQRREEYRKDNSHAMRLRRVESVEQLLDGVRIHSDAGIPNPQRDRIPVVGLRLDQERARTIHHTTHCVRRVQQQVQDHLLQLHAIAADNGQTFRAASLTSTVSKVGAFLMNIARKRFTTSDARLASRIVRLTVSPAPTRLGGSAPSISNNKVHTNVQFMVKDSNNYASTGGWGFAQFNDGKAVAPDALSSCFPCHRQITPRDLVFSHYSP